MKKKNEIKYFYLPPKRRCPGKKGCRNQTVGYGLNTSGAM